MQASSLQPGRPCLFDHWPDLQAHLHGLGLKPGDPSTQDLEVARAQHEAYLLALSASEELDGRERLVSFDVDSRRHRVLTVEPQASKMPACGVLYLRGAGWWGGSLHSSRPVAHRVARETGMLVCAVDYRRIPEHPFPAQLDDVWAALSWLSSHAAQAEGLPQRWILWGESAGASLAVCVAARASEAREGSSIDGLVLLYGNHGGPHVHVERSRWIWERYLAGLAPNGYARAIPALQKGHRLPAAYLAVGLDDPLLNDSRRMHHHWVGEGLASRLKEFAGLPHSFAAMAAMLRPAALAVADCAAAARSMAQDRCGAH